MTVQLVTNIKKWIGTSSDVKPISTASSLIPPGSTFLESDTGDMYRFDSSEWIRAELDKEASEENRSLLLTAILLELQKLNERFELVTA